MRTATLHHVPGVGIEIATPYEADFIAALKVTIPHFARKWAPERKLWIVAPEYRGPLVQLLQQYFTVIDADADAQQEREQSRQSTGSCSHLHGSHAVMHLLPSAPPELVKAAFHCLAKLYHPDRGGDLAAMQKLNQAYEKLHR